MLDKFYMRSGSWIIASITLAALFFLLDELFIFGLSYVPPAYQLVIHRTALFIVVATFIFITQFALYRLVILNRQLLHSGKLSALGEMSAMFTHELIRPLTQIDLFAQIQLENPALDPEIRRFCTDVSRQLDRAKHLIESLRTFGRNSADNVRQLQSLNDIVEEAMKVTGPYLQFIDIRKKLAPGLPPVLCDTYQIEQVLANILINARDALQGCKEKAIALQTSLENEEVTIVIEDSGPGIKSSVLKHIFEPFYTTKAESNGTGLGLPISQKIIADHGGSISVESQPGRTRFLIRLPVSKASLPPMQHAVSHPT